MARSLELSTDEAEVSFQNLNDVGFYRDYNGITAGLTPFGREFLRAISDTPKSEV